MIVDIENRQLIESFYVEGIKVDVYLKWSKFKSKQISFIIGCGNEKALSIYKYLENEGKVAEFLNKL